MRGVADGVEARNRLTFSADDLRMAVGLQSALATKVAEINAHCGSRMGPYPSGLNEDRASPVDRPISIISVPAAAKDGVHTVGSIAIELTDRALKWHDRNADLVASSLRVWRDICTGPTNVRESAGRASRYSA